MNKSILITIYLINILCKLPVSYQQRQNHWSPKMLFIKCTIIYDKTFLKEFFNQTIDAEIYVKNLIYNANSIIYRLLDKNVNIIILSSTLNYENFDFQIDKSISESLFKRLEMIGHRYDSLGHDLALFVFSNELFNMWKIPFDPNFYRPCRSRTPPIVPFTPKFENSLNYLIAYVLRFALQIQPDVSNPTCCPDRKCIYYSVPALNIDLNSYYFKFSPCTSGQIHSYWQHLSCYHWPPNTIKPGFCGNRIVEQGERCDDLSSECDPLVCQLRISSPSSTIRPPISTQCPPYSCVGEPCPEHSPIFKGYLVASVTIGVMGIISLIGGYINFRRRIT